MAGYIGSKTSVTQVDGYNRTEADGEFVNDPNSVISVSGSNVGIGTDLPTFTSAYGGLHVHSTYPEIHLTGTDSGSGASDGFKIQKNSANHVYLWNYENAFMAFGTNNSERLRIDSSGRVTMPYQPSISGRQLLPIVSGTAHLQNNTRIYFVNTYSNTGGAWNNSTGIFTCPVAGKYFMQANLLIDQAANATDLVRAAFRINGSERYVGYDSSRAHSSAYYDGMMSFGGILTCSANDQIDMIVTHGRIHWGSESSFCIYLIG